jgi:adenylate kinase family enzyme
LKIIIFGASGTGKTTLGKSIAKELNWAFLDSDEYYWEKTNPPFQIKIPLEKRNEHLKTDFNNNENVITTGSLCTWSKYWDSAFDLGIFLRLPKDIRMKRLANREIDRYGEELNTNPEMREKSKAFLKWAEEYDDETSDRHSITQHRNWIKVLDCPIIEFKDDLTTDEMLTYLKTLSINLSL